MIVVYKTTQKISVKNTPGRTRTCYPLLRRQMLYPDELRGHRYHSLDAYV